ncbi:uncharacterized protein CELE_ZK632.12 [Caenorhabditis elegans]|uniref:Uncharacterized protein ZK632.12 n=1 Tax=Caenorhabditis elegans TaxID=6239 RepID=YOTB_CAEEL|nr:Uncharacterized protein CELE_ZK632.12 [Caenorhabditis elegans]P34657.2 RecName: Full=Uncharacterized protein ZK632.12 [Caenorhabditis elegans]CAA80187.1 Uncharacterized protein CELE_ZK632.12 [Caenorhabditis elegans]|eukprot:NP_499183.1 Uncharacterized protein CELE_ZK632.12 [Caenorhabditis elegans]
MVDRLVNSEVNSRRMANVEQCFGKMGEQLSVFGRVLVGEGVLVKMCRKKPKQRQFFLFNDILVYGNIVISKKRYNKQRILRLEGVQVEDLEDDGIEKHGWIIKTPAKSFAVYAATETEKREWMLHIERCVTDLLERGNKQAATAHAAVWVPDGEAVKCMVCGKTQFNLVQRRHHCRNCGRVVCGACSSRTFRIDNVHKKPVRVCDHCFDSLSSATPGQEESEPKTGNRLHHEDSSSDSEDEVNGSGRSSNESRPTFYREDVQQPAT